MESVQEVNLAEMEEKFGADLVKKLSERIESAKNNSLTFKIDVNEESKYFPEVIFATWSYSWFYEIQLSSKKITQKYCVGRSIAKQMLELMDSFEA